jgi:hypothetical protein
LTNQGFAICCDTIRAVNPSLENWKWIFAIRTERDFLSVGISLLVALASNPKCLTLHALSIDDSQLLASIFHRNISNGPVAQWHDQVATVLRQRLEKLTIWDSRTEGLQGLLDLSQFHRLKHLTVPIDRLVSWQWNNGHIAPVRASEVLPKSLHTMRICASPWRLKVHYIEDLIQDLQSFPQLQLVELCFQENFLSAAYALSSSPTENKDYVECLKALELAPYTTRTLIGTLECNLERLYRGTRDEDEYFKWHELEFSPQDLFKAISLCKKVHAYDRQYEYRLVLEAMRKNKSYKELDWDLRAARVPYDYPGDQYAFTYIPDNDEYK